MSSFRSPRLEKDSELTHNLNGYLATCVATRARNRNRLKQGQAVALDEGETLGSDSNDPYESMGRNEELQQLTRAMERLPYHQREAVILHLGTGMKFGEIAKSRGVSFGAAKRRYRCGIDRLSPILNGEAKKMKPENSIKRLIKKSDVSIGSVVDKRVLVDSLERFSQLKQAGPSGTRLGSWGIAMKTRKRDLPLQQ
jgi:RNA polymerase sigma factor (sigma-70 family)